MMHLTSTSGFARLAIWGAAGILTIGLLGGALAEKADPPSDKPSPEPHARRERVMRRWAEELQLTEAQREQLKALRAQLEERRRTILSSAAPPEQKREQLRALRGEFRQQLQQVLTPEQREKLKTALAERRHRWRRGFRGGPPRGQRLARQLNLTETQQQSLRTARQEYWKQVRAAHAARLTEEQRREKLQAARAAFQAEVKRILTPEQWEKLQSLRQRGGFRRGMPPAGVEQR